MNNTKLIASDVDGTLLPEGTSALNPKYYDIIRELKKKGIVFVVASGRQYHSVRTVFEPVEEDVYFIADNGAHILKGTETISCNTIPRKTVEKIVAYVRTLPDSFMLFSTPSGAYTDCKNQAFIKKNEEGYHIKMIQVEDILTVTDSVMKIALCCEQLDAVDVAPPAEALFGKEASVMVSGAHWVDFMAKGMDKGGALKKLQKMLGIKKEQTMAFGDNINDMTLLQSAKESYAVQNARPALKEKAKYIIGSATEDAVLKQLEQLAQGNCSRDICKEIQEQLFIRRDEEYQLFQAKLIPTIPGESVIGVRTPAMRELAKHYAKDDEIEAFLQKLPHKYYDENNLQGFIISRCKDYKKTVAYLDRFLPYVDNWATCDLMRPKVFAQHLDLLDKDISRWIGSDLAYTIRFGIEMRMSFFLKDNFEKRFHEEIAVIRSDEYYINMMIAWYFATALSLQWKETIPYLLQNRLDDFTHNKTIQKARESFRITEEQKEYLNTLKRNAKS